jgi:hypothetical protein
MPILQLYAVPQTDADVQRLGFFNRDHHVQVSDWIMANHGLAVERYVLYPMPPMDALGTWLINHQSWHAQIDAILGVSGYNLLDVDVQNRDALQAFLFLHGEEHRQWERITGVG